VITSAPTSVEYGVSASVTITVTSWLQQATGNVTLTMDGTKSYLGTVTGTGGTVTITIPAADLTLGNHNLRAQYEGDTNFLGSSSAYVYLNVGGAITTTTITQPAQVTYGSNGSVTVTVSSGAGTPTGSVTLTVDSTTLPAQGLVNGSTTFTIPTPSAGSHPLSASYEGAGNFGPSSASGVNLTVTVRPLTITADAKTKVYGAVDPALTYQITSGSLVGGDAITGALTRVAGETISGSPYAIQQGTLTAGSNYQITYIGANLTITARPLTITADAKTKVYGAVDPALTYQITSGSLVGGDAITGALTRVAGETISGSPYAIQQGTLTAGSNYQITYIGANLTITKASATVTLGNLNQAYDGTPKSATATTIPDGLSVTITYDGSATAPTEIGSYMVVGTVNDANYQGSATDTLVISSP
jgi:hypothetical protein